MKKTAYLCLLLILPLLLRAQDKTGYFALKPGDWFDMQVTQGTENGPYSDLEPTMLFTSRYVLRYYLQTLYPNGNQQYLITQERVVRYFPQRDDNYGWAGYDSYYPPYKQGLDKKPAGGSFHLEITPTGQIVTLVADKDQPPPPLQLVTYSPKKSIAADVTYTYTPMQAVELRTIVEQLFAHRPSEKIVPIRIAGEKKSYSQLLIAASFPLTGNTLLKGIAPSPSEKTMKITLPNLTIQTPINSKGEFSCLLQLSEPTLGFFKGGGTGGDFFMVPGDTLTVNAGNRAVPITFTGSAAMNTQLGMELSRLLYAGGVNINNATSLSGVLAMQNAATKEFNTLLHNYEDKASPVALDYYKTAWRYNIASDWLLYLYSHNYQADSASLPFQRLPEAVASGIDYMPVLLNPYKENYFYRYYLGWALLFQQSRISMSAGGSIVGFSFYKDYFALLSSLKGYPLYYMLSEGIRKELKRRSWQDNQRLKPYMEDFIHNCGDSSMTIPIINDWQSMNRWAPGNVLPFTQLPLVKGKTYNFQTTPGKITCLILNGGGPIDDSVLVNTIKRHPDVTFVYAAINESFPVSKLPILSPYSNVTVVELENKDKDNYATYGFSGYGEKNIVILDKWGKITADHIQTIDNNWSTVDEAIEAAAKVPRVSFLQKSNILNIAGWSFGSILFTALVGFWIYRARIRRIRAAAAIQSTIRELEIKAIRSQMNPHFIFNALNSIQSLINTSQYKAANTYLVKFSMLLRYVLQHAEKNTLTLEEELNTIRLYCELEQLRFDFTFKIAIAEDIATELVEIPGMILQPLVENAILHGLAAKGKAGILHITAKQEDATLLITVRDNGNGYHPSSANNGQHNGVGLKLVRQRLELFKVPGQSARLDITNHHGTTALLTIPIEAA
ncbi:MAG: histidine kinase [Chitinophaga sp.]|uniref:sensor histidine kinase n=1 Tax=Chitinophaga sp. TaxID=1869181 RepID=UPI001B140A2D|nr:histidine kinase [Chitinophaga sp.]MBO9727755.1 histidine kinase [Chitinophaga sp.]